MAERCTPAASCAGEAWWSSQFLLPGATEPLSKEQQIAVTHALAAWTGTVEGLQPDAAGSTASHLAQAWAQVTRGAERPANKKTAASFGAHPEKRMLHHTDVQLLASGKLESSQLEAAQRAWRWRELLQRAMDGCDSTSVQR